MSPPSVRGISPQFGGASRCNNCQPPEPITRPYLPQLTQGTLRYLKLMAISNPHGVWDGPRRSSPSACYMIARATICQARFVPASHRDRACLSVSCNHQDLTGGHGRVVAWAGLTHASRDVGSSQGRSQRMLISCHGQTPLSARVKVAPVMACQVSMTPPDRDR